MEDFYNAMTTYINSKKPKCQHERTFYWQGWRTCVECRLCIYKVFSQDPYSNVAGYNFTKPKEERFPKFRDTLFEMMCAISRDGCIENGEMIYYEPPNPELLPIEILDYLKELSWKCMNLNVKCNTRSLCAVVLWEKVKFLYPKMMTLTKFSKKVGVSIPTIIKTCKKLK